MGSYSDFLAAIEPLFAACRAGDGVCQREGLGQNAQVEGDFTVSADLDMFWAHWRYNLEDPGCELLKMRDKQTTVDKLQ